MKDVTTKQKQQQQQHEKHGKKHGQHHQQHQQQQQHHDGFQLGKYGNNADNDTHDKKPHHASHHFQMPYPLIESVLNLALHLIRFGYYYHSDHIKAMMEPLVLLLHLKNQHAHGHGSHSGTATMMSGAAIAAAGGKGAIAAMDEHAEEGVHNVHDEEMVRAKEKAVKCIDAMVNFMLNIEMEVSLGRFFLCFILFTI